jgi:hypothetical protein
MQLPWFTNHWLILGVFVCALVGFHWVFLKLYPMPSIFWKRVDYFWLSMAILGLLSAVGGSREIIAKTLLEYANARAYSSFSNLKRRAEFGSSSVYCREFIRGPGSPPVEEFNRRQSESIATCEWFKAVVFKLDALDPKQRTPLDQVKDFGQFPLAEDKWPYDSFAEGLRSYHESLSEVSNLTEASASSGFEQVIKLLGPLLLAVALALRITKVSAEVIIEKQKNSKPVI